MNSLFEIFKLLLNKKEVLLKDNFTNLKKQFWIGERDSVLARSVRRFYKNEV
jgi:hypothetical protein